MNRVAQKKRHQKARRPPRSDAVFGLLKDRILRLEYLPGTPLTELEIAEELKVSRTPIREALRRLEHEQLVRIIPRKGATVIGLTEDDVVEAYLIRQALEGVCVRCAAQRISDENLARIESALAEAERLQANGQSREASDAADELHRMVLDIGGTPRIRRMVANLCQLTGRLHEIALALPGRLDRSIAEHRKVFEALRRHDGDEAERAIRAHVESTQRDVMAAFHNHRK